jgi:hypothetical protein
MGVARKKEIYVWMISGWYMEVRSIFAGSNSDYTVGGALR